MQVPGWWIVVSGIFFVVAILTLVIVCIALFNAVQAIKEMSLRMKSLSEKVEETVSEVKSITRTVGGNVGNITHRMDLFTAGATKKLELFSTIMMLFGTAKRMGLFAKSKPRDSRD